MLEPKHFKLHVTVHLFIPLDDVMTMQVNTTEIPDPLFQPLVMASSPMGPDFGVFGFLPTTHAKINPKQISSRFLRDVLCFALVCLQAQIAVRAGNKRT